MGSHYSQRLVVEGTFADGHQEDLTSLAISQCRIPRWRMIDKDNFTLSQGNGQATITATVGGHRATATVNVKDFAGATTGAFATMCCR